MKECQAKRRIHSKAQLRKMGTLVQEGKLSAGKFAGMRRRTTGMSSLPERALRKRVALRRRK